MQDAAFISSISFSFGSVPSVFAPLVSKEAAQQEQQDVICHRKTWQELLLTP